MKTSLKIYLEGETESFGKGLGGVSNIKVQAIGRAESLLELALFGYKTIAKEFLKNHPEACRNCPAYKTVTLILENIDRIKKEAMKNNFPNFPDEII